jgi:hypothetical protein
MKQDGYKILNELSSGMQRAIVAGAGALGGATGGGLGAYFTYNKMVSNLQQQLKTEKNPARRAGIKQKLNWLKKVGRAGYAKRWAGAGAGIGLAQGTLAGMAR